MNFMKHRHKQALRLLLSMLYFSASTLFAASGKLIVQIGAGDGRETVELAGENNVVHALDSNLANIETARKYIQSKGLYGRVSVEHWTGEELPYIDNLVNQIVVSDTGHRVSRDEIERVLAPRGVFRDQSDSSESQFTKPVPAGMDSWPHWLYGPHNNAVSKDQLVGVSRNMQWIAEPKWERNHNLLPSVTVMISCDGRIYSIEDRAPIGIEGPHGHWVLSARDAFNGLQLWTIPMPKWGSESWGKIRTGIAMRFKNPTQVYRRLVANGDKVYVTLGFAAPLTEIDGATGKILQTYKGTENTAAILYDDGVIYLSQNTSLTEPGKNILALDPKSGKILWEHTGVTGVVSRGDELKKYSDICLTIGSDKLFFLDRGEIVALDKKTGNKSWTTPRPPVKDIFGHSKYNYVNLCTLVYHKGGVFLAQIPSSASNLNQWQKKQMHIVVLEESSGKERWKTMGTSISHFTPADLFIHHGMVWTLNEKSDVLKGLDIQTGETKKEYKIPELQVGHHHRCYRNKGTENFYLYGEEGIEYINFKTGEIDVIHWLRGACAYGIMPANGCIYLPGHSCGCHADTLLGGFMALNSNESTLKLTPDEERLTKGSAYEKAQRPSPDTQPPASKEWSSYRHDNMRSGATTADIPDKISKKWTTTLQGKLTAPVVARGLLFCASTDKYQLHALDADTGDIKWTYFASGPIDSPPSHDKGRLFFGTRTGYVICLDAISGKLAWKFKAAPVDQRLGAYDRVESAWPVHGSVLVQQSKVYVVAGRSMHLNTGLYTYVLDAATGKILHKGNLQADTDPKGENKGAVMPDILVSKDNSIFMRKMAFDKDFKSIRDSKGGYLRARGGFLDDSWLNNVYWELNSATAQIMAFDNNRTYGVTGLRRLAWKSASHDTHKLGSGYNLFAYDLPATGNKKTNPAKKRKKSTRRAWTTKIPIRAQAMILDKDSIYLAGATDKASLWTTADEKKLGQLLIHSKETGEETGRHDIDSAPVLDGLAAANGKIYLVLKNGTISCYGE